MADKHETGSGHPNVSETKDNGKKIHEAHAKIGAKKNADAASGNAAAFKAGAEAAIAMIKGGGGQGGGEGGPPQQ